MAVFLNAKSAEQGGGIALGVPAFEFGKLLFEFGSLYAILVGEIRFCIYGILLLHHIPEHGMTAQHSLDNGAFVKLKVVLRKNRQTLPGAKSDSAMSRGKFAGKNFHQSRLSGTVCADYTIAVATVESEVYILKEHAFAKLHAKVVGLNHYLIEILFFTTDENRRGARPGGIITDAYVARLCYGY